MLIGFFSSIGGKIVTAMVCASVIGSGAALHSNFALKTVDKAFLDVTAKDVPGALDAFILTAQSERLGGLSYRLVTEFKARDIEITKADIDQVNAEINSKLDAIQKVWPEKADDISAIRTEFDQLRNGMKLALEAAFGGDPDKTATVTQEQVNPVIKSFNAKVRAFAEASQASLANRQKQVTQEIVNASRLGFIITGLGSLLTLLGGLYFARRVISRPVTELTEAMKSIADGQTKVVVPGTDRHDELGTMAQTVQVFQRNAETVMQQEEEKAALALAERENRQRMLESLAATFERSVGAVIGQVGKAAHEIEGSAGELAGIASETSRRVGSVASASVSMADCVRSAALATDELGQTIQEISINIDRSQTVAVEAAEKTDKTVQIVTELAESTRKISSIIQLISNIANQTNLLALNATIEAARAGDAGRGFAIVASEVKALANETSKATVEIAHQIETVQASMREAVAAITSIDETIGNVREVTAGIAMAVQLQNSSMQGISANVTEAVKGSEAVSGSMVDVSRAAETTGQAAQVMKASATELSASATALNAEVEQFLRGVRAS